jgi:hypothetical protein
LVLDNAMVGSSDLVFNAAIHLSLFQAAHFQKAAADSDPRRMLRHLLVSPKSTAVTCARQRHPK